MPDIIVISVVTSKYTANKKPYRLTGLKLKAQLSERATRPFVSTTNTWCIPNALNKSAMCWVLYFPYFLALWWSKAGL